MAAIGLHVLVLAVAVGVPLAALIDAGWRAAGSTSVAAQLVDWQRWLMLLGNTAIVAAVAVAIAVGVGTIVSLLLVRTNFPGRRLMHAGALLGACIPVYVGAILMINIVPAFDLEQSAVGAGVLSGLIYLPLGVVVLCAVMRAADPELEDLARLDASPVRVLWSVTLPRARAGIATAAMLITLLVATDFSITDLVLVRTFAEEVYTQFQLDRQRVGPLLTSVPVLILAALLLVVVQMRCQVVGAHAPWRLGGTPRRYTLGRWRWPIGVVLWSVALLAGGWPVVKLVLQALSGPGLSASISAVRSELLCSVMLAAIGATVIVIPAVGLAWSAVRLRRWGWGVGAALVLLLATPAPVVGISLVTLLNRPGPLGWLYDSPGVIVVGYLVRFLPVALLLLIPAAARVPVDLERAARVDGCNWVGLQRHVTWPSLRYAVAAVWLVVVILCVAEVGTTVLVAPPGWPTASVRAFTLMHFGVYHDLATLALLAAALVLLPWAGLLWSVQRWCRAGAEQST